MIFPHTPPHSVPANPFRHDQQSIDASYAMAIVFSAASGRTKGSIIPQMKPPSEKSTLAFRSVENRK